MADFEDIKLCDKKESAEFGFFNVIGATVATTGYKGGDSGHGGRTYICIEDVADSDFHARASQLPSSTSKLEIMAGGDSELDSLIEALRWTADTLERLAKHQ